MSTLPRASESLGFFRSSSRMLSNPIDRYDPGALGLAFSGGGYRATLFHAGAVLRLNELGLLSQARHIASVSGGSITTGILAMNWDTIFEGMHDVPAAIAPKEKMLEHFTKPILKATSESIDIAVSVLGLLPGISGGNQLARTYDKYVFKDFKLKDITSQTRFCFCASNLQTGGLFRFYRDRIADSRALEATTKDVNLSIAVAASSGFPPILAPLRLDLSGETVTMHPNAKFEDPGLRKTPVLVDGGVYDNIGLEPIWHKCGNIIAASAGGNAEPNTGRFNNGLMMKRIIDQFLFSSIDWRERILINLFMHKSDEDQKQERCGCYWTLKTPTNRYDEKWNVGWTVSPEELEIARKIPTRLSKIDQKTQYAAIRAGYSYADASIRKYHIQDIPAPEHGPDLP